MQENFEQQINTEEIIPEQPMVFAIDWGRVINVPRCLRRLLVRFGKATCVYKDGATIIESSYTKKDKFTIQLTLFATDKMITHSPKLRANKVAIVFPLHGGADCDMVNYGALSFAQPFYSFARVQNDIHQCRFPVGISAFLYIFIDDNFLRELQKDFRRSGIVQRLIDNCDANRPDLIQCDQQVMVERMQYLFKQLWSTRTRYKFQRKKTNNLVKQLIYASFTQAGSDQANAPAIPGENTFTKTFEQAAAAYLQSPQQLDFAGKQKKARWMRKELWPASLWRISTIA